MTIPSGRGRNGDLSITIILLKSESTLHLSRSISPSIDQDSKQTVFPKSQGDPKKGATCRISPPLLAPTESPKPFPNPGAGCCFTATPSQGHAGGGEAGCGRARLGLDLRRAGAAAFPQENVPLADGSAYAGGREESRRLIKHPWSLRLGRGATKWLMPGARSKRCRQARPLTAGTRLAERERPGDGNAHQCRTPVALGAQRSVPAVKGGIARAPGWLAPRRGSCCPIYFCLHSFTPLDS